MLQYPEFDPVALRIGPVAIHWYGLMYLWASPWSPAGPAPHPERPHHDADHPRPRRRDLHSVLGVVLGGRLGYVLFYKPSHYLSHPLEVLYLWEGGMSFHGGLMFLFARKKGLPSSPSAISSPR